MPREACGLNDVGPAGVRCSAATLKTERPVAAPARWGGRCSAGGTKRS